MKELREMMCEMVLLVCVMLLVVSGTAEAASVIWDGSESSDWVTGLNWDTGGAPETGDTVWLLGGSAIVNDPVIDENVTTVYSDINMGKTAGDTNLAYLTVANGGTVNIRTLNIGTYAGNQGRVDISDGATINGTGAFVIGRAGPGLVNMTDGTLDFASHLIMGDVQDYGTSEFNMSGGDATFNWVGVGDEGGGTSIMNLSGNAYLQATNLSVGVHDGTGILNIKDNAHYKLMGGRTRLGEAGVGASGTIHMTGGTIESPHSFVVGYTAGATGTMTMTAGTVTSNAFVVGLYGDGDFTMSGGTLDLASLLRVGEQTGKGIMNMEGGLVKAGQTVYVGYGGEAASVIDVLNMTDGEIQTGDLNIGQYGLGRVDLFGGVININYYDDEDPEDEDGLDGLLFDMDGGDGLLNLCGGILNWMYGDYTDEIAAFVNSGDIVAYDGTGTVIATYDINSDLTTVTAIPEPATMMLMLTGVLVASRKKR